MLCQSLLPQLDVSVPDVKKKKKRRERQRERVRDGESERERERVEKKKTGHQLRFARSIKLLDLEMFSGGAHFLRLRVVNGA